MPGRSFSEAWRLSGSTLEHVRPNVSLVMDLTTGPMQLIHFLDKNFAIRQIEEAAGEAPRFPFYLPIQALFDREAAVFTDTACPIPAMLQVSKNSPPTSSG
jgi:hypothetical protein